MKHTELNRIVSIVVLLLVSGWCAAQTKISGKVVDKKGEAVPFANVFIKDTYDGTSTDENGKFSFTTSETGDATLVISFVGYLDYEQAIKLDGTPLHITPTLESKPNELDMVVISAGSFEASDEKKAVLLKARDIVTTAGANGDIFGAIQTLPGTQQVGEQEGLFVRGGSAAETKTIIDEMIVQNPFFTSVPDVPQRGRFSPFLFKGIMFSTGGYSAQYGQALSSALILKTQDLAPHTSTGISIMPIGSNLIHTQRWEKTSLSVSGAYINLEPYFAVIKQLTDWDKEPEGGSGGLIFRHKTSKTGILKLHGTYSKNRLSMYSPDVNDPDNKIRFELKNSNLYVNSTYRELLGKKWSFFTGLSYAKDVDDMSQDSLNISSDEELGQYKMVFTRELFKNSNLKFGGEVHKMRNAGSFNQYIDTLDELYAAGFVETEIFITSKLAGRVGGRFENSQMLGLNNIAPRTSLAYKTGKQSQVALAYGDFYQTPENQFVFQVPDLKYEKATHYILNYQWMNEKRTFRIEAYHKEYDDLVKNIADSSRWLDNSGSGFARGFDVFWRDKKTIKNVDYWISYSFLDTERNYREFPVMAAPTFTSKHTLSVVYKHWLSKLQSTLGFTYTYASGRPYYNPNRPDAEFHTDLTDDYHNFSISMGKLTSILGNFTVIFASVSNVFNTENVFAYRYSEDGTNKMPVGPPNLRTFFIGIFISIGTEPI